MYTIELTSHCNHACVGCGNPFSRKLGYMRLEQWKGVIERLRDTITSLRITGGECTLHPDFAEFMAYCDTLGVPFVVFSNGHWVNPAATVDILSGLKHLQGILISLHGHDQASHRMFVQSPGFDIVLSSIRAASSAKIKVGTNTILTRYNVGHLEAVIDLSVSLGASSVAFSRYYGEAIPDLELTEAQLYEAIRTINQLHQRDPKVIFNNCVPLCFLESEQAGKGCTSGFTHCTIDPLGDVRPCTHSPYVLGNVLRDDIHDLWESDKLQEWRGLIPSECLPCDLFSKCRGGCRATAYLQGLSHDPLMRQPVHSQGSAALDAVQIYSSARPTLQCKLWVTDGAIYLVGLRRMIVVAPKAMPILEVLDGSLTMELIRSRFDQVAVDFIGNLALMGLVNLESESVARRPHTVWAVSPPTPTHHKL